MRFPSSFIAVVFLPGLARATAANETAIAQHIPDCAIPCLIDALKNATCSPSDLDCVCDVAWQSPVLPGCAMASCDVAKSLATMNGTATACNLPITRQTPTLLVTTTVLCATGIVCAFMRLLGRHGARSAWMQKADDWMMMGNAILLLGMMVCTILAHHNGYGKDTWTLPTQQIRTILILIYNLEIQYTIIIHLTKLYILHFYLQFFPFTVFSVLRTTIYATIVATIASGIGFTAAIVFQTTPINSLWDVFNENIQPSDRVSWHGIDVNAFGWSGATINLVFDLWLMLLPMPELIRLTLPPRKKIVVCLMFAVGSFVTGITIPRILYMQYFRRTTNPMLDLVWVSFWGHVEATSSVILACTPTIAIALTRVYRKHARSRTLFQDQGIQELEVGNEVVELSSSTQLTKTTVAGDSEGDMYRRGEEPSRHTTSSVPTKTTEHLSQTRITGLKKLGLEYAPPLAEDLVLGRSGGMCRTPQAAKTCSQPWSFA